MRNLGGPWSWSPTGKGFGHQGSGVLAKHLSQLQSSPQSKKRAKTGWLSRQDSRFDMEGVRAFLSRPKDKISFSVVPKSRVEKVKAGVWWYCSSKLTLLHVGGAELPSF